MSLIFLVIKMPLPWLELTGLTIRVTGVFFSCIKFIKSYDSAGKLHVLGKKLNSQGIYFCINLRYLARLFFSESTVIAGKWFILWYGLSPFNLSIVKSESSHRMSQSALACVIASLPLSLSGLILVHFHPNCFFAIYLIMSYLTSLQFSII
jgi:hypothetical protein